MRPVYSEGHSRGRRFHPRSGADVRQMEGDVLRLPISGRVSPGLSNLDRTWISLSHLFYALTVRPTSGWPGEVAVLPRTQHARGLDRSGSAQTRLGGPPATPSPEWSAVRLRPGARWNCRGASTAVLSPDASDIPSEVASFARATSRSAVTFHERTDRVRPLGGGPTRLYCAGPPATAQACRRRRR